MDLSYQQSGECERYDVFVANNRKILYAVPIFLLSLLLLFVALFFLNGPHKKLLLPFLVLPSLWGVVVSTFAKKLLTSSQVIQLCSDKIMIDNNEIYFTDISEYKEHFYQGIYITLVLRTGKKVNIILAERYNSASIISEFSKEFSALMETLPSSIDQTKRTGSFMTSNWWLAFLVLCTACLLALVIYCALYRKAFPSPLWFGLAPIVVLWGSYLKSRKMERRNA